ncbi:MAG: hypothetical protein LBS59_00020 [Puniceicoccales bacterium]|nr:hypothetical protein [Puniceicoccales bacterium]
MKIKLFFINMLLLLCGIVDAQAKTQIIAHRGHWDKRSSPENSLSSLENAIKTGAYGSELDVRMSSDGVLVLNHDEKYKGVFIEKATYKEISKLRLANGEPLPTLQQCADIVKKQKKTKLIIEIKPHSSAEKDRRTAGEIVKLVNKNNIADLVDYISFSWHACKELIKLNPGHRVSYLRGDKPPKQLKAEGLWGMAYSWKELKEKHPEWLKEAKALGLVVNVWTVNDAKIMRYFIGQKVDFITTDKPLVLKELLKK